jgi:hypothetical protein
MQAAAARGERRVSWCSKRRRISSRVLQRIGGSATPRNPVALEPPMSERRSRRGAAACVTLPHLSITRRM